jgi:hypothetical protein
LTELRTEKKGTMDFLPFILSGERVYEREREFRTVEMCDGVCHVGRIERERERARERVR